MPNAGRTCQTTDAQPCVTDGGGCPAGTSRHASEPGEDSHVSHLWKAIKKLSQFSHCAGFTNMTWSCQADDDRMFSCRLRVMRIEP